MKTGTMEKVMDLFESDRIYLDRGLTVAELASAAGENVKDMKNEFEACFGYSFSEMVSIWRLCHARNLLMKRVPYSMVWRLSGFKSRKEMERELGRLAY